MSEARPIVIIECYGSGVRICDGENILTDSTSYALIEADNTIIVGELAEHQAHLRPREVSTQFWANLSASSTTKHIVSNAELALYHLQHAWQSANCSNHDVIFITPANFDKHQLGLLLGICEKLSIHVAGIVCNAALVLRNPLRNSKAIYLDLLLQQLVITELNHTDSGVEIIQPSRIFDYGIQNFIQNCAKTIASEFVNKTRFDPLHTAQDEQQFFDQLPSWLMQLKTNEVIECRLSVEGKHFAIEINQQQLQKANQVLFEEVAAYLNVLFHDHDTLAIYCSASCNKIYALHEFLSALPGCAVIQMNAMDIAQHALHSKNEIIREGQVHYITRLTWSDKSITESLNFNPGKLSNISSIPTHVLIGGHAYSLQQEIYIASNDSSTDPIILLENRSDCLCKISSNNVSVDIEVLNAKSIMINHNKVSVMTSAKIGDILSIQTSESSCEFIKVVQHEA